MTTKTKPKTTSPQKPADTKIGTVIKLLKRKQGASIYELVKATGWQPHSTRAALTGLRKTGLAITSEKVDGVRYYRAASSA